MITQKQYEVRFDFVAEIQTVPMDLTQRIDTKESVLKWLEHIPQLKEGLPFRLSDLSMEKARASFTGKQLYFAYFTIHCQGLIVRVQGYSKKDAIDYLKNNSDWLTSVFVLIKEHMILNATAFEIIP